MQLNDVLTIRDGRFYLEGKPFAEISFNKFDLFWQLYYLLKDGKGETQEYADMVASQDRALAELGEMGFRSIRIFAAPWGIWEFRPIFNDAQKRESIFYRAMDMALDLCDKNGIKVNYSLGASTFTDTVRVGDEWQRGEEHERELVANPESRCRQELYRYIDEVVTHYKNRKTILMWEISNEVTLNADMMPGPEKICQGQRMPNLADVARFFDDVAKRIKANDPLRLVNSGGSCMRGCQWNMYTKDAWLVDTIEEQNKAIDLLYAGSAVDVLDIHYYTNNHDICTCGDGQEIPMNLATYMESASRIERPLMIGEVGGSMVARDNNPENRKIYEETPDYYDSYWDPNSVKWVKSLCDEIVDSGTQLTYWWCYSSDRREEQTAPSFDVKKGKTDAVLTIIADANKRLKATLGA